MLFDKEEEDDGEINGLAISVCHWYFTYFESFNVYKNIHRPWYVSEKAYNCSIREI